VRHVEVHRAAVTVNIVPAAPDRGRRDGHAAGVLVVIGWRYRPQCMSCSTILAATGVHGVGDRTPALDLCLAVDARCAAVTLAVRARLRAFGHDEPAVAR
jgi:hypothetical protein